MNPEPEERVEVGRYLRENQAQDRALVVLAMGVAYWIVPQEGLYALTVEARHAPAVSAELLKYEAERSEERQHAERSRARHPRPRRVSRLSLFAYVWVLGVFFLLQNHLSREWTTRGAADSGKILHGEGWRVLTALTLHGDLGHLVANLGAGLIFAGALLPWLGTGWTWLGIVLSGAAGNWLNAWGFRGTAHSSIGASTAVFGGLGMLVGWQIVSAFRTSGAARRLQLRQALFPIGAGLALLAYLGTGGGGEGERVDFMAHLFGMLSGSVLGAALGWGEIPERTPAPLQKGLAALALLLPCLGWLSAWLHGR